MDKAQAISSSFATAENTLRMRSIYVHLDAVTIASYNWNRAETQNGQQNSGGPLPK